MPIDRRPRRARPALLRSAALAACFLLPACGSSKPTDAGAAITADAYAGSWTLESLSGEDVQAMLPEGALAPTLELKEDGGASGFAGVNRLSSRFDPGATARGEPIFGPAITTRMAGPAPLMALESRYLDALARARVAAMNGRRLTLLDNAGIPLAVFAPAAP